MDEQLDQLLEETSETSSQVASTWNETHETLLAGIADRTNCNFWMHEQCSSRYEVYNFYLTIPSIAISGLAGFASLMSTSMIPTYYQELGSWIIGIATLTCGVLQSINQVLKSQQKAEEHRSTSVAYSKLYRTIASELALRRDQRLNALDFLRVIRAEQDRLHETAPQVLETIKDVFRKRFAQEVDLEKPETVGFIHHTYVNSYITPLLPKTPPSSPQ